MRALWMAAVMMIGGTGAASASVISGGSISLNGTTDYSSLIGSLSKFNSSNGILTGVSFTVGYGFNSTITMSATTDSKGSVATESSAQFSSTDSAIKAVLNSLVNTTTAAVGTRTLNPAAYDLVGTKSIYNVGPSYGSSTVSYASAATATNTYTVSSSSLSAFVASSSSSVFDVYGTTLTGLNIVVSGGNASAEQRTTATQSISVNYTYTAATTQDSAVPEPASLALLGLGAAGILASRRRR